jgi:hypothetical protein
VFPSEHCNLVQGSCYGKVCLDSTEGSVCVFFWRFNLILWLRSFSSIPRASDLKTPRSEKFACFTSQIVQNLSGWKITFWRKIFPNSGIQTLNSTTPFQLPNSGIPEQIPEFSQGLIYP